MKKPRLIIIIFIFTLCSCSRTYYKYLSTNSFLENGWYVFKDFKYQGAIKGEKPNGHGILVYANGTTIEGNFIDGVLNGDNINFNVPSIGIIKSQVVNGEQVYGEINYTNGNYYQGGLKSNRPSGEGILRKSNGDLLAGNFNNGNLEGLGIEYTSSTGEKSIGNFKQGKAEGTVAKINKADKIDGKDYKNGTDNTNPTAFASEKLKEIEKIEIDIFEEEAKTVRNDRKWWREKVNEQEKGFKSIETTCNIARGFYLELIPQPPKNMRMYNWESYFDTSENIWVILSDKATTSEIRAALLERKEIKNKEKKKDAAIRKECEIWKQDPVNYKGDLERLSNGYSLQDIEGNKSYIEQLYAESEKIDEKIKQKIKEQELIREQRQKDFEQVYKNRLLEDANKMRNEFDERCAKKSNCLCKVGWLINCSNGKGACANCQ